MRLRSSPAGAPLPSWCSSSRSSPRILARRGLPQTFANLDNVALILKYSGIYGIAAIGAAMIIGAGGIDLAPGAVIALASVITGHLFTIEGWPLRAGDRRRPRHRRSSAARSPRRWSSARGCRRSSPRSA